jgi:hypothetical protein
MVVLSIAIVVGVLPAPRAALAHHSFAMFDANQTLTALATVKELQWGNPHTWLEIVVLNQDKTERSLSLELNGLSGLRRNGWLREISPINSSIQPTLRAGPAWTHHD